MQRCILGVRVDATSYPDATARVLEWACLRQSRYVCAANVHMVMEAYDSPEFRCIVNRAALVTPDGVPLVWTLRSLGIREQQRVYGPDLTLSVCAAAAKNGLSVGFYGGKPQALDNLVRALKARFPGLDVAYAYSPPFRPLTAEEDEAVVSAIDRSGARILFVGMGCPKQERWMFDHKDNVRSVMLGVGAAFDLLSGEIEQAPPWLQRAGLEWAYRLTREPQRLWLRYMKHNPRFSALIMMQLLGIHRFEEGD